MESVFFPNQLLSFSRNETPKNEISSSSKKFFSSPENLETGKTLTIVLKDEMVIDFLRENTIDPEQFIKKGISNYINTQKKIDPHILKGNYEEIKKVISQKKTILKLLSEIQQAVYLIKFPETDKILLPLFGNSDETIMTCNICNIFRVYTKKGMISHQRKCLKTIGITPSVTPPLPEKNTVDVLFS